MTDRKTIDLRLPSLDDVREAAADIAPHVLRTPLMKLDLGFEDRTIYAKLENLQPNGAFKMRPAFHAIKSLPASARADGVYTISTGNMASGLAAAARDLGVPMAAYMAEGAPEVKIRAVERYGGEVRLLPKEKLWNCIFLKETINCKETLIHPVMNNRVLAANGTIGLEIVEDLADVDAVYIPYGGGGGTSGIGSTVKNLVPDVRIVVAEGEHSTPLSAALAAGEPVATEFRNTFVESIGGTTVFPETFGFVRNMIDSVVVAPLDDIAKAMATLFTHTRTIAEGAGAASLAAAIADPKGKGNLVCIISGGNIGIADFCKVVNQALNGTSQ